VKTAEAIHRAHKSGRAAFVGYLPLGYPDLKSSIEAAVTIAENGADIIELGPPYSDPVMDGPVIQEATNTALKNGFRVRDIFTAVSEITSRVSAPVVVMTYWNLVLQYGPAQFAHDLAAAGGAGLVTPDITPDAADEWLAASGDLDRIFLAAPTSSNSRLELIGEASRGFVYAVSTMGITGERQDLDRSASDLVQRIKSVSDKYVCVGIGISTQEHVRTVSQYADGAIVGSALVRALRDGGVAQLAEVTRELSAGTHGTRSD
jgi:tryptophan synthase alpha chain